jgi:predicted O-methyltransferase YrrM
MNEEKIKSLDYSHGYTIDMDHAIKMYQHIVETGCKKCVEIGSYLGISTIAIDLAAENNGGTTTSVDLCDEIDSAHRQKYWNENERFNIKSVDMDCTKFLEQGEKHDFIFHDASHGDGVIPEYQLAWNSLNGGGLLVIHDLDQITMYETFLKFFNAKRIELYTDKKGRITGFVWK